MNNELSADDYRKMVDTKDPSLFNRSSKKSDGPEHLMHCAIVNDFQPMRTEIVFAGLVPGNNGKGGLRRMHFTKKAKLKEGYIWQVKQATKNRHTGPVRFELVRHSIGSLMDYDNLVSTGKMITDAIVSAGVLPDDNPNVIVERYYSQTRALSKESQMTVIRIIDLVPDPPST